MKRIIIFVFVVSSMLLAIVSFAATPSQLYFKDYNAARGKKKLDSRITDIQLPFIKNESQIKDSQVKYYAKTFAGTVYITDNEIVYNLQGGLKSKTVNKGWVLKERFINAERTKAEGIRETLTRVNYFKGKKQSNWRINIPTFEEVSLGRLYKHIKANFRAFGNNLEKIFIIEKGAKPKEILVEIAGANLLHITKRGDLEIITDIGSIILSKPVAYQIFNNEKKYVEASYILKGNQYGFNIGTYDTNRELIIDPLLASTSFGSWTHTISYSIDVDSIGNVFVAGLTASEFPTTPGAYDTSYNGSSTSNSFGGDVFISKFDNNLTTLLSATFLGGSGDEGDHISMMLKSGNLFLTGLTTSSDFPITTGAYNKTFNGKEDVFISKLDSNLSNLLASTFLGSKADGFFQGSISLYATDNYIFLAGSTESNIPTTPGAYDTFLDGSNDGFISKFNDSLTTLNASTYIGGSSFDHIEDISVDKLGNVFVVGYTGSPEFPTTTGAYKTTCGLNEECYDGFITKFDNNLTTILASTFVGGTIPNAANDLPWNDINLILINNDNSIYVSGSTNCRDFPITPGAWFTEFQAKSIFISKFNNNLTSLLASTFIPCSFHTSIHSLSSDLNDNILFAGATVCSNFPTPPYAYDSTCGTDGRCNADPYSTISGNQDIIIAKIDSNLSSLLTATYLGGSNGDGQYSVVLTVDNKNNIFITGSTSSPDFPTVDGSSTQGKTIFIVKFDPNLSADIPQYSLSITKTGTRNGLVTSNPSGINCGSDCEEKYPAGTKVILTAIPVESDAAFAGWSDGPCSGTGSCEIKVNSDITVKASFIKQSDLSTTTTTPEISTTTIPNTTTTTIPNNQCIAESIYGKDSEELALLRKYRDKVLNKTETGRQIIEAYYKASPLVAEILQTNETAKANARKVFDGFMPAIRERIKR